MSGGVKGLTKVSEMDEHEGQDGVGVYVVCFGFWMFGHILRMCVCPRLWTVGGSETEWDSITFLFYQCLKIRKAYSWDVIKAN